MAHLLRPEHRHDLTHTLQHLGLKLRLPGSIQAHQRQSQAGVQIFAAQQQQRHMRLVLHQGRAGCGFLQRQAVRCVVGLHGQALQRTGQVEPGVKQVAGVGVHHCQAQRLGFYEKGLGVRGNLLRLRGAGGRLARTHLRPQLHQAVERQKSFEIGHGPGSAGGVGEPCTMHECPPSLSFGPED